MHQEHVVLTNVEIEQLYAAKKKYLQDLKLDIIHEDLLFLVVRKFNRTVHNKISIP
jgi:hypothetical protein